MIRFKQLNGVEIMTTSFQEMIGSKFYNKDGSLTDYALSCGYVHEITNPKTGRKLTLTKEHSTYCVSCYDFDAHKSLYKEYFYSLVKARKYYKWCKKEFMSNEKAVK